MKIGILTFTDGTNIGQRLQNYALQTVLERIVSDGVVYTIKQGYPFNKMKHGVRVLFQFLKSPWKEIKKYRRYKKFETFNKKNIRFAHSEMPFNGDNSRYCEKYDCFVVGSDQIWNPESPFVGDNFFLTFAKRNQRLTYAPSFSVESIPDVMREKYIRYLNGFDHITVREDRGAEIVMDLVGKVADVVLDPTLLLDAEDYDAIKSKSSMKPTGRYLLAMFLGDYPESSTEAISSYTNIQTLRLDSDAFLSPDEFLDLVEGASAVLTDSYHITVFAILYRRPFINFKRSGKGSSMNSRFETLYRLLNIENRTWEYISDNMNEIMQVDFTTIMNRLKVEKERSLSVLNQSICKIKCNEKKS